VAAQSCGRRRRGSPDSSSGSEDKACSNTRRMTATGAAAYLGVSYRKMSHMLSEGVLKFTVDPLDKRRKLVRVSDLDERRCMAGELPE
jgi:hypothetical protein